MEKNDNIPEENNKKEEDDQKQSKSPNKRKSYDSTIYSHTQP